MPSDRAKRLARMEKKQAKLWFESQATIARSFAEEFLAMSEEDQKAWVEGYEEFLRNEGDEPGST